MWTQLSFLWELFGDIALELPLSFSLTLSLPLPLSHSLCSVPYLRKAERSELLLAETGCKVLQTYRADYVLLL